MLWLCSAIVTVCCIPRERGQSVADGPGIFAAVRIGSYSVRGDQIRGLLSTRRKEHDTADPEFPSHYDLILGQTLSLRSIDTHPSIVNTMRTTKAVHMLSTNMTYRLPQTKLRAEFKVIWVAGARGDLPLRKPPPSYFETLPILVATCNHTCRTESNNSTDQH